MLVLCLLALQPVLAGASQGTPHVVVSIKPVHDLVIGVTEGILTPTLLIPGGVSPHDHALRPSDMRTLQQAQLIVWIGPELETFLTRPLDGLNENVRRSALLHDAGLILYPLREGGLWDDHDHGHAHGHDHDHDHDHGHGHGHGHGHDHAHAGVDSHVWLSPENARRIVRYVSDELTRLDPDNAPGYQANRDRMLERLDRLDRELDGLLTATRGKPFIVFHDAYQYFERHYGLTPAGAITLDPSRPPGARRIQQIRRRVADAGALCVFSEPQFRPAIVNTVTEGTPARTGVLDPLGADLPTGPQAYEILLRNLAQSLVACLAG